jgi:hypothetical protein
LPYSVPEYGIPREAQYAAHVEGILEVEVVEASDITRELGKKSAKQPTFVELAFGVPMLLIAALST